MFTAQDVLTHGGADPGVKQAWISLCLQCSAGPQDSYSNCSVHRAIPRRWVCGVTEEYGSSLCVNGGVLVIQGPLLT